MQTKLIKGCSLSKVQKALLNFYYKNFKVTPVIVYHSIKQEGKVVMKFCGMRILIALSQNSILLIT